MMMMFLVLENTPFIQTQHFPPTFPDYVHAYVNVYGMN